MGATNGHARSSQPVKLSLPLEYQQDIFREVRDEDQLLILARGLGLLRIVTNLLHAYDAAGNNIIVIVGAEEQENHWIGEALAEKSIISNAVTARGLTLVNTDLMSVTTRERMYTSGGIFSITSRILIVDLLTGLLNPDSLTGMVVLHAERAVATSLEAFIVRVYRQRNKVGFLKAFSDDPQPFTTGFAPLATMMRNLFLRKTALYPRFHVVVAKALQGKQKAEVIELEVPMTESMKIIQQAVMECVEVSVAELRKSNLGLEMDEWTLDGALHRNFDTIVRRQLNPIWHRLSWKTKQIVSDLTVLRNILNSLLAYDSVSFQIYLDTILATHQPPPASTRQTQSPWLFLDAANMLFDTAKKRVYTGSIKDATAANVNVDANSLPKTLRPILEEQPKWAVLSEVLEEIERDAVLHPEITKGGRTILIMCADWPTCRQLREYLGTMHCQEDGRRAQTQSGTRDDAVNVENEGKPTAAFMMRRKLRDYIAWKKNLATVSASLFSENLAKVKNGGDAYSPSKQGPHNPANGHGPFRGRAPPNKRRRIRGGGSSSAGRTSNTAILVADDPQDQIDEMLTQVTSGQPSTEEPPSAADDVLLDALDNIPSDIEEGSAEDPFGLIDPSDLLVIHPFSDLDDANDVLLEQLSPSHIIMYSPSPPFIRRVEVHRSIHSFSHQVRVYFLYYGASVEEQTYLSAVRREKDAFTRLIREKGTMALTLHQETSSLDPQEAFLRTVNTRIAGGGRLNRTAATAEPPRVVVDVREFRSSLPSLLHGRNVVVVPCTLTVGDYILTNDICVERKSVRDLIQSLSSGRLFNQAETMQRHYKHPVLLIEFDHGKAFTLEMFSDAVGGASSSSFVSDQSGIGKNADLQSRIVMLSIAFPKLKICWSESAYQTAEMFEELKKGCEEPDPIRAVQKGLEDGEIQTVGIGKDGVAAQVFNREPAEMLHRVPGVDGASFKVLSREYKNLREVVEASLSEISGLIGAEKGRRVWRFLNRDSMAGLGGGLDDE